jgi:thiaminase/transcriptional activator TenA
MEQSFSDELHQAAMDIWGEIFAHPFLHEVQSGTLPLEKFRYYVIQDYHYLEGFGRAVSLALAKAPDADTLRRLVPRVNTPVERPLHVEMFALLGIDEAEAEAVGPSPTNRAYVNHMVTAASMGGTGEAAAALLPCPWTYHLIGSAIRVPEHPVYTHWTSAYRSGLLERSTAAWRYLVDKFGAEGGSAVRESMKEAFLTSSRYERMFWDMAYSMEQWPV